MSAEDDAADVLYETIVRLAKATDSPDDLSVLCQSFAVMAGTGEEEEEKGVVHSTTAIDMLDTGAYWADDLRNRGGIGFTPR